MVAIRRACKNLGTFHLEGCTLYTTAEPCPMCRGAILWAGISKVYYGCNVADTERIGFRDREFYEGAFEIAEELCRAECLEIFAEYTQMRNKKPY